MNRSSLLVGARSGNRYAVVAGVVLAVVALVGMAAFGWQVGSRSGTGLAAVVCVVGAAVALLRTAWLRA